LLRIGYRIAGEESNRIGHNPQFRVDKTTKNGSIKLTQAKSKQVFYRGKDGGAEET